MQLQLVVGGCPTSTSSMKLPSNSHHAHVTIHLIKIWRRQNKCVAHMDMILQYPAWDDVGIS